MSALNIIIFLILINLLLATYAIYLKRKFGRDFKLMQLAIEDLKQFQEHHIELEAIFQVIQEGVIITDLHSQIILASQKAAALLRTDLSNLREKNIEVFLPIANLKEKSNINLITELELQNGEIITAEIKSSPIISQEELKGTLYTIHDKTQEKIFEEMKLDFVAMAAHQLRTPLTSLKGYLFLLSQSIKSKLTDQDKTYLDKCLNRTNKLSSLIEYLINATKIGDTKMKLNLKPSSLEYIISAVKNEYENTARQKEIEIEFEKPEKPLPVINIDPDLIETVLDNLIINAIEHSLSKKISIRVRKNDEEIIVSVQDYGKGIPSHALGYMFTKFYKVPSHLLATPGSGLGLYVSKLIVETHRGRIWVDSIFGRGSIFSFSLPLIKAPVQVND